MVLARTKMLRGAGYVAFAAVSFILCLYLTFPGQAVAQRMSYEIQKRSGGDVSASVGSAGLSFPLGVSASDVELRIKRKNDDDIRVPLGSLSASLDSLALLTFSVKPRLSAEIGDGSLTAAFVQSDASTYVEAEVESLNLLRPPVLPSFLGVPLTGELSAEGDYALAKKTADSSGAMSLSLENVSIGPGPVAGFTIPEAIGIGTVRFTLAIEDGQMVIRDYVQEGGQVQLDLSGGITLNPRFMSSSLDGCIKFKFADEAFLKKYPKLETAVQLAGARFKQDGEGFLNVPLKGMLSTPRGGTGVRAGRGVCGAGGRRRAGSRPGAR